MQTRLKVTKTSHALLTCTMMLTAAFAWSALDADDDRKQEQQRLDSQRQDQQVDDKRYEEKLQEQKRLDDLYNQKRQEQKRQDDKAWDRRHGY